MAKRDKKKSKKLLDSIIEPVPADNKIKFSFEYYDLARKYCLSNWGTNNIAQAIHRLKEANQKTFNELTAQSPTYHFHPVNWKETTQPSGFPDARVNNLNPYQFALLGINDGKARIFGGLGSNVFYIVWFDLEHKIWPSGKKNT